MIFPAAMIDGIAGPVRKHDLRQFVRASIALHFALWSMLALQNH
jgi:hypothetical protein